MKNIGIKCIINSGNLYAGRKKVKIYHYSNNIKISDLGSGFLSIVDSDFESLLYSIKNENFIKFDNGDPINFISALSRKFLVRSGAKFGGMLRVYIGNEKHSNMILNLRETEEANSLIAKARVAHSVKKKLVYCFPFNSKIRCLSVNWFH